MDSMLHPRLLILELLRPREPLGQRKKRKVQGLRSRLLPSSLNALQGGALTLLKGDGRSHSPSAEWALGVVPAGTLIGPGWTPGWAGHHLGTIRGGPGSALGTSSWEATRGQGADDQREQVCRAQK